MMVIEFSMKYTKTWLLVLLMVSQNASAILIDGIDWLLADVDSGNNLSAQDIRGILEPDGSCPTGSTCIVNGENVSGYTWASADEVWDMMQEVLSFSEPSSPGYSQLNTTGSSVDPLIYDTLPIDPSEEYSYYRYYYCGYGYCGRFYRFDRYAGLTNTILSDSGRYLVLEYLDYRPSSYSTYSDYVTSYSYDDNYRNHSVGAWFRQSATVPEPSSLALMLTGTVGLIAVRRRKKSSE